MGKTPGPTPNLFFPQLTVGSVRACDGARRWRNKPEEKGSNDPAGAAVHGSRNKQTKGWRGCAWYQLLGQKHSYQIPLLCYAYSILLGQDLEKQTFAQVDRTHGSGLEISFLWWHQDPELWESSSHLFGSYSHERRLACISEMWTASPPSSTGCYGQRCIQRIRGWNLPPLFGGTRKQWLVRHQLQQHEKNESECTPSMERGVSSCEAFAFGWTIQTLVLSDWCFPYPSQRSIWRYCGKFHRPLPWIDYFILFPSCISCLFLLKVPPSLQFFGALCSFYLRWVFVITLTETKDLKHVLMQSSMISRLFAEGCHFSYTWQGWQKLWLGMQTPANTQLGFLAK